MTSMRAGTKQSGLSQPEFEGGKAPDRGSNSHEPTETEAPSSAVTPRRGRGVTASADCATALPGGRRSRLAPGARTMDVGPSRSDLGPSQPRARQFRRRPNARRRHDRARLVRRCGRGCSQDGVGRRGSTRSRRTWPPRHPPGRNARRPYPRVDHRGRNRTDRARAIRAFARGRGGVSPPSPAVGGGFAHAGGLCRRSARRDRQAPGADPRRRSDGSHSAPRIGRSRIAALPAG
jgi:hypothetical protein